MIVSPENFASSQQHIQRRLSLAVSDSPQNQHTLLNYILMFHRYFAPRELRSVFHYVTALCWMILIAWWWLLVMKLGLFSSWFRFAGHYSHPKRKTASSPSAKSGGGVGGGSQQREEEPIHEWMDVVWRRPKSGITCWQGDHVPLTLSDMTNSSLGLQESASHDD